MIYDKTYSPLRRTRRTLSVPASRLRAGSTARDVFLVHMRETDGGFECAEGVVPIEMPFAETPFKLYAVENGLISVNHVPQRNSDGMYAVFSRRNFYGYRLTDLPRSVTPADTARDTTRKDAWNVVLPERTLFANARNGQLLDYSEETGGLYGLQYAGRFFVVTEDKIVYTKMYCAENWELESNTDVQGSGTLTVPPECGDLVTGIVYRDDAYFFAQYGVWKLHMGGKVLNTKTMLYPHGGGEVIPNSCQVVDGHIYFLTTKGLWRFDGNKFERVPSPCLAKADLSAEVESGVCDGQYFAHVALADGNRRVVAYDPYFERDRFLAAEFASFGAKDKAYAIHGGVICELKGRGLSPDGDPCSLLCTISLIGNNPCAEWVRIEGEGEFTVEASTKEDGAAFAKGKAGEKLYLSRVLRGGELSLCISTFAEDFRIAGVTLGIGEDEQYDD